jgi:hypothetical protein
LEKETQIKKKRQSDIYPIGGNSPNLVTLLSGYVLEYLSDISPIL